MPGSPARTANSLPPTTSPCTGKLACWANGSPASATRSAAPGVLRTTPGRQRRGHTPATTPPAPATTCASLGNSARMGRHFVGELRRPLRKEPAVCLKSRCSRWWQALMLVELLRHMSGTRIATDTSGFPGLGRPDPARAGAGQPAAQCHGRHGTQPDRLIALRLRATENASPCATTARPQRRCQAICSSASSPPNPVAGLGLGLSLPHAIVHEMGKPPARTMHTEPASHSACRALQSPTPTHHHERIAD